jgi:hypothetical protein
LGNFQIESYYIWKIQNFTLKKWLRENFLLARWCSWALFSFYRLPGILEFLFKRPQVNIHLHLVLAFEITWHSPRVPAGAASAILEFARGKYISSFIHYLQSRRRLSPAVLHHHATVLFPSLPFKIETY